MYEFIFFFAEAASASCEGKAQAARAKPKLTSCPPDQAAPDLCRSNPIHL